MASTTENPTPESGNGETSPAPPVSGGGGSFSFLDMEAKAQHIAQVAMDQASKGLNTSGTILSSASKKAEELAQKTAEVMASLKKPEPTPPNDGEQSAPAATSRGIPVEAGTQDGAAPAAENGFPLSILTWCSSICGSEKNQDGSLPVSSLRDMATQATATFTEATTKMEAAAATTKQQASDAAQKAGEAAAKAKQQLTDAAAAAKQKASELAASAKAQAANVTARAVAITTPAASSASPPK